MTKKNKKSVKIIPILSESEIEKRIQEFRDWIKTFPEFPQNLDSQLLVRYLNIFHYQQMDRSKRLFQNALEFRARYPKVFINRDPMSVEMTRVLGLFDMVPLLQHTKDNHKVIVFRLLSSDVSNIILSDCAKGYFMASDLRFSLPNKKLSDIECGEIVIFDLKNLTLQHLTKAHFTTLKLFFTYLQIGHPIRLAQFHAINCNALIDKLIFLVRPFISSRLFKTLKIHRLGSMNSLHEFVPKEFLPEDYGGHQGKLSDLRVYWERILFENRAFLQNDGYFALKKD